MHRTQKTEFKHIHNSIMKKRRKQKQNIYKKKTKDFKPYLLKMFSKHVKKLPGLINMETAIEEEFIKGQKSSNVLCG